MLKVGSFLFLGLACIGKCYKVEVDTILSDFCQMNIWQKPIKNLEQKHSNFEIEGLNLITEIKK